MRWLNYHGRYVSMDYFCFSDMKQQRAFDSSFFFLNDTAPPEIYPLPLHDAFPIFAARPGNHQGVSVISLVTVGPPFRQEGRELVRAQEIQVGPLGRDRLVRNTDVDHVQSPAHRSEEHTSELQSRLHLVCRLLLEKK